MAVHLISVGCVQLQNLHRLDDMEAVNVREVKFLHLCDMIKAFKIVLSQFIPGGGASVFDSTNDVLNFNDVLSNLFIITFEYAFVNSRKCITLLSSITRLICIIVI